MAKKIVKTNLTALLLAVIGIMGYSMMADAGNLEPSAGPGSTMKSLDEIFGTVDSLASGRLTYPEKLWIDAFFPPVSAPFLTLQIDGNDVPGESPVISLDREDTIVCIGFEHEVYVPYDLNSQQLGTRVHPPVSILKYTDKTTPLLYKALCLKEPVTSAEFRFYRADPGGSGAEQQYFTVLLESAYIVKIETPYPNIERVTFLYNDITWTYMGNGATHHETVRP